MENAATNTPNGMESEKATYRTSSTEPKGQEMLTATSSGVAASATSDGTPARSSPLSADEAQRLYRIRKDRANRFMVSVADVDFMLELLERG